MKSLRAALLLALVAGAVAVAPAGAGATPPPIAHAAGGDARPPLYPAIVNVRLVRAQSLLEHATKYMDLGQPDKAVTALNAARSNMTKAWLGAKYVIQTAPPPVAAADSVRKATVKPVRKAKAVRKAKRQTIRVTKAHATGGAVAGASPYADQY